MILTSRAKLSWIMTAIVCCEMLAAGIIYPIFPQLLSQAGSISIPEAARWGGYISFTYAVMQFVFAPVVGAVSDIVGRKPVILASLLGFGLNYLLLSVMSSIEYFAIGYAIAGIFGAGYTVAFAYVADITSADQRIAAFGRLSGGLALGVVVGPLVGGVAANFDLRLPFVLSAVLLLLLAGSIAIFLPESLPVERRKASVIKRGDLNPMRDLFKFSYNRINIKFILALSLLAFGVQGAILIWPYFTTVQLGWSDVEIAYSLAVSGVISFLAQAVLIGALVKRAGSGGTMLIGLACYAVGWLGVAISRDALVLYLFIVPMAVGGISEACMRGLLSEATDEQNQGRLQGVISSTRSLATALALPIFGSLFAYLADPSGLNFAGGPFVLGMGCALVSALIAGSALRGRKRQMSRKANVSSSPGGEVGLAKEAGGECSG